MLTFVGMNLVHVVLRIVDSWNPDHDAYWWGRKTLEPDFQYIYYIGFEIVSCAIIVSSKTDEDCFHCFNRDRSILRYSKF